MNLQKSIQKNNKDEGNNKNGNIQDVSIRPENVNDYCLLVEV